MNYEKKYKEALEVAQKLYQDCPNGKNDRLYHTTDLEKMFPELKESENEKVRKEIISFIQDDIDEINLKVSGDYDDRDEDDIAHQIWCKKAIAWLENIPYTIDHEKREGFHLGYKAGLEKQSETFTKKDVDDAYLRGISDAKNELEKQGDSPIKWNKNTEGNKPQVNHSVLMKTIHGIAEGEWKGEYWEQYRWAGIVRDSDVLSWMEFSDLEKQCEQKPAWSKEDERMRKDIIRVFKGEISFTSEKENEKYTAWLKSLKQRCTWKPSDEQMKALHDLNLTGNISYAGQGQVLIGLYNDLKKLKGE